MDQNKGMNFETSAMDDICYLNNTNKRLGSAYVPKVRKPYTITKQRERWTDEEHQKFVEALRLYGRAWRQIEEHIGTKTAIQIRSHAQKFFTKIARDSTGEISTSLKPTEIPPPRPKKKPIHPYPRKMADSQRTFGFPQHNQGISSLNGSFRERDQSPTSVLSSGGSNECSSADSRQQTASTSPASCTTNGQLPRLLPTEKEKQCMTSNSFNEHKGSQSSLQASCGSTSSDKLNQEISYSNKDSAMKAPSVSIKLFGKTVLVTDLQEQSFSSREENCLMQPKSIHKKIDTIDVNTVETSTFGTSISPVFLGDTYNQNVPWWTMYQGLTFPYLSSKEENPVDEKFQKERSSSSSNSDSVSQVVNIRSKTSFGFESQTEFSSSGGRLGKGFL